VAAAVTFCCTVVVELVTWAAAAANAPGNQFGEGAAPVETGPAGAAGARCPTPGSAWAVLTVELVLLTPATLLTSIEPVDPVPAVDVVESVLPVAPPLEPMVLTLEPVVLWLGEVGRPVAPVLGPLVLLLDDGESLEEVSAWATPVGLARKAATPRVTAPVPSHVETSLCGRLV
jgi:hypothetical protein